MECEKQTNVSIYLQTKEIKVSLKKNSSENWSGRGLLVAPLL